MCRGRESASIPLELLAEESRIFHHVLIKIFFKQNRRHIVFSTPARRDIEMMKRPTNWQLLSNNMLRCYHQFHLSTSNEETRPSLIFIFLIFVRPMKPPDDEVITSLITFDNQQHEISAAAELWAAPRGITVSCLYDMLAMRRQTTRRNDYLLLLHKLKPIKALYWVREMEENVEIIMQILPLNENECLNV